MNEETKTKILKWLSERDFREYSFDERNGATAAIFLVEQYIKSL